jgi:hypothetical protein
MFNIYVNSLIDDISALNIGIDIDNADQTMISYNFENILCWKPPCILLFTINKPNAILADLATALAIN